MGPFLLPTPQLEGVHRDMKAGARPLGTMSPGRHSGRRHSRGSEVEAEQTKAGMREREAWAKKPGATRPRQRKPLLRGKELQLSSERL